MKDLIETFPKDQGANGFLKGIQGKLNNISYR